MEWYQLHANIPYGIISLIGLPIYNIKVKIMIASTGWIGLIFQVVCLVLSISKG